jgi:hypothetical protein
MRLQEYLKEAKQIDLGTTGEIARGVKGMYTEGDKTDPKKLQLVRTQHSKVTWTPGESKKYGGTFGNVRTARKRWVGHFFDPSKPSKGEVSVNHKWIPYNVEIIFNTKKDMEKFLELVK